MKCFIIITLFLSSLAFAQDSQQEQDARAIRELIKSAKALSEAELSCQQDSDCTVIAVGSRACGGPAGYLIASENNSNLAEISFLAHQSMLKEAEYNRRYRILSICSVLMPPEPSCHQKVCKQLNTREI